MQNQFKDNRISVLLVDFLLLPALTIEASHGFTFIPIVA